MKDLHKQGPKIVLGRGLGGGGGTASYLYQLKDTSISSTGIPDAFVLTYDASIGKWIASVASSNFNTDTILTAQLDILTGPNAQNEYIGNEVFLVLVDNNGNIITATA